MCTTEINRFTAREVPAARSDAPSDAPRQAFVLAPVAFALLGGFAQMALEVIDGLALGTKGLDGKVFMGQGFLIRLTL